jgi:hypothetical protein
LFIGSVAVHILNYNNKVIEKDKPQHNNVEV